MSVARVLARNTGVQLVGRILSTILGVFMVGVMTRYLGQEGFGVYSTANAYLQIFALVLDLGINVTFVAMLGEHADDPAYEKRCTSALFTLRLVMAFVVLGIAPFIWLALYPHETTFFWSILALNGAFFCPSLLQIVTGVQQRHFKMWISALGEVSSRALLLGLLLLVRYLNLGLVPMILCVTLGSVASLLINLALMRESKLFRWNWDVPFWKDTIKRSWPIGVSIAFNLVYFKADMLILSRVRSLTETGVYGAAYRVLEILITVPFMYAGVLLPILARTWAKRDHARLSFLISRSIEAMLFLVCPMIVGMYFLGPRIMGIVAGSAFVVSGEVLKILVLAVAMIYVNTIVSHAIVALQIQRKMLPIYFAVAVLSLTGYLLLIPRYGMWAAAWITVFSEACVTLGALAMTHAHAPIHLRLRTVLATVAASLFMGWAIFELRSTMILIPILAGALVYVIALLTLGGISKEEIQDIVAVRKETEVL
jgi:O-antigen/teichoic acid export membrane protein